MKNKKKIKKKKKNKKKQKKKKCVTASELYNDFLGICFDEYSELPDAKRNKMDPKYKHEDFLKNVIVMAGLIQEEKVIMKNCLIQ